MDALRPTSAAVPSRPPGAPATPPPAAATPVAEPSREERIASLEQEHQQCWSTYMYCEAADFMSSEEKATSRRMSQRMGEIDRELAHLRGPEVLDRAHVKAAVDGLLEAHPLARVGSDGFKAAFAAFGLSGCAAGSDSPVQHLQAGLREGILVREDVDGKILRSGVRRKATATGSEEEVRREAAVLLTRDLPREGGLMPDLQALLGRPTSGPAGLVAELVREGRVELTAADVNRARRCLYEQGQLGRAVDRFRETKREDALQAVAELLDQQLPYTPDEKRQALAVAGEHLAKKLGEVAGRPETDWQVKRVHETLARWEARGLGQEDLRRGMLGGGAPPEVGPIEEGPGWIVVGDVRLERRPGN